MMTIYNIRILHAAEKSLKSLDKPIIKRLVSRINWLAENLDSIPPQPLSANLSGFYKLRVGDYRVIYEIIEEEQVIIIHLIGHRKDIYKQ